MKFFTDTILATLTVISQILTVLGIIALTLKADHPLRQRFAKVGFLLAFIVALVATLGSLTYSDILGYEPCKFCWFQRIFMYPQVLLLGLALYRKEWNLSLYALILSIIGGLLALNHYILQITGTSLIPCSAVGYSSACAKVFTLHFGYITIPMMALSAFALMTVSLLLFRKGQDANKG